MFSRIRSHKDVVEAEITDNKSHLHCPAPVGKSQTSELATRMQCLISSRVGEICGLIAHDINNPLQVLFTKIQLAQIAPPNTADLKLLEKETIRVVDLVRTLGQLSRIAASDEFLTLKAIFNPVSQLVQQLLAKRRLQINCSSAINSTTLIRKDLGTFVVLTVFLAACKYLPPDKEVVLSTEMTPTGPGIRIVDNSASIFHSHPVGKYEMVTADHLKPEMQLLRDEICQIGGSASFYQTSSDILVPA